MKEIFTDISAPHVLQLLLMGVLLFLGLRLIRKGVYVYIRTKQANPVINRFFPLFEFFVWIIFLVLLTKQIFKAGMAESIILIVLPMGILMWAGSFVIRDWMAGIVFKAEDRYRIGDIVCFKDTRGSLTDLGYRSLTLETADGILIEIPYSTLVRESTMQKISREIPTCTFQLEIPAQRTFPEVQQFLNRVVMCAPWCSLNRKPTIRMVNTQENKYLIEITSYIIDSVYAAETEAYVKQQV